MRSSLVKFTAAAATIGTLAVAIATTPKLRDGAGASVAGLGVAVVRWRSHCQRDAPGYGYGPRYYANDPYAYRGG